MQITVQMLATGQAKDESGSHLNVSDPGRDAVGIIETFFFFRARLYGTCLI